ncbi:hypothetical protein MHYP_G00025890 [Metynnis hypsauchen]
MCLVVSTTRMTMAFPTMPRPHTNSTSSTLAALYSTLCALHAPWLSFAPNSVAFSSRVSMPLLNALSCRSHRRKKPSFALKTRKVVIRGVKRPAKREGEICEALLSHGASSEPLNEDVHWHCALGAAAAGETQKCGLWAAARAARRQSTPRSRPRARGSTRSVPIRAIYVVARAEAY